MAPESPHSKHRATAARIVQPMATVERRLRSISSSQSELANRMKRVGFAYRIRQSDGLLPLEEIGVDRKVLKNL